MQPAAQLRDHDVRAARAHPRRRVHPLPVRILHWTNAIAMIIMIGSGWRIYNEDVIFGWLLFPIWPTLGGDPATAFRLNQDAGFGGALQWHFFGMWLLVVNGLTYLAYGLATGRFKRMLLPLSLRGFIRDIRDALRLRLEHDDITRYNTVQKVLYIGIIVVGVVQVFSGLAIWKPVQFSWLTTLFYDFQGARLAHFIGMAAICFFLVVHVALALLVPRTLLAMAVTGGPRLREPVAGDADEDLERRAATG